MKTKRFDVIVIGAGSGLTISSMAAESGHKVAVVEKGPFGGTCLNRGCIPSKMLIHSADVVETIKNAETFGIYAKVGKIDWRKMQQRVWKEIDSDAKSIELGNRETKNITVYKKNGIFVDRKVLKVGNELISAEKIFICAGTRPSIPKINGLDKINYYTSDDVMRRQKQARKMIIVGGRYISAELGHFFSSLGTEVIMLVRGDRLIKNEDEEISIAYTRIASRKYNVLFNSEIIKVGKKGKEIDIEIKQGGKKKKITCDALLLATGRIPNTDILAVEKTGVRVSKEGYAKVNEYMETNVPGIWAIGDIAGVYFFKHSANLEASYCTNNAFSKNKIKVDYSAMPHAIFTSPQIAGVGMTEQELKDGKIKYKVGKYDYINTGMGAAINDKEGFVKVLADLNGKILGCHIIGSDASTLIHEVIVAMKAGLGVNGILDAVHIHPALSEVVHRAFGNVN